jgi:endoglucanase
MRTVRRILAALLAVLPVVGSAAAGTPDCPIAPGDPLSRGISLVGWFDDTPARPPDPRLLADLAGRGLTHVRLPVRAETVSPRFAAKAEIDRHRRDLSDALDRLLGLGLAVVVDLHGGERFQRLLAEDPAAGAAAVADAWRGLAPLVASRPAGRVFAEILNEPPLDDARWLPLQADLVARLAPILGTATPILSTGGPQRVERLAESPPSPAPGVWAVHYYDPMVFTHQGADWMRPDPIADLSGVPFPFRGADERVVALGRAARLDGRRATATYVASLAPVVWGIAEIERDMARLGAWSRANRRPVVIGEFGALATAPAADRRTWLATVVDAAEKNCLGWTHWEYRDGFGFLDPATGRVDEAILSALLPIPGDRRRR